MHFKLEKYTSSNLFLKLINLTNDNRHKEFIKLLSKSCLKGDTIVYVLKIDDEICGFIGLSASKIDSIPCINIDYLHVVEKYRKNIFENLNNQKISEFLISFSIKKAVDIKNSVGLRWLILTPDNEELEKYYIDSFEFTKYKSKKDDVVYLFIAIKSINNDG
jgi:hypothetical protein